MNAKPAAAAAPNPVRTPSNAAERVRQRPTPETLPCEFLSCCVRVSVFRVWRFSPAVFVCAEAWRGFGPACCVSTCDTWLAEGSAFQIPVLTGACSGQPTPPPPPSTLCPPCRTRRVHPPCRSAVSKQFSLCKASNLNNPGQERACIIAFAPREACQGRENNFFIYSLFFFFISPLQLHHNFWGGGEH